MNADNFERFEAEALAAGFNEALERRWAPDAVIDTHSHPFDAEAVITQGEMWLTCDGIFWILIPPSKRRNRYRSSGHRCASSLSNKSTATG